MIFTLPRKFIDSRSPDAFNGWPLDCAPGGHVAGAVNLSASWIGTTGAHYLVADLAARGITPATPIEVYDAGAGERDVVAAFLGCHGFTDVRTSVVDPAEQRLEKWAHFELLVPVTVLAELLRGQQPYSFEHTTASSIKFVEASWGPASASYDLGHIPGFFHIDTDEFERRHDWMLGEAEQLTGFAARHGFYQEDVVVVASEDPISSFRLATILRHLGVRDVRVVNGGLHAWRVAGFPVAMGRDDEADVNARRCRVPKVTTPIVVEEDHWDASSSCLLSMEKMRMRLGSPDFALVDIRTWSEYRGDTSGYDTFPFFKGRIQGAVYAQSGHRESDIMTAYRNVADRTMRSCDDIRMMWCASGLAVHHQHLAFMCGSGWRASEVFFYALVMGLTNVSLFSDGWIGWSLKGYHSVSHLKEREN